MFLDVVCKELLLPKIVDFASSKGIDVVKEKAYINKLEKKILDFNSNYENSQVDCGSFQRFLEKTNNLEKILNQLYCINNSNCLADKSFVNIIAKEALEFVNSEKVKIEHPIINNESIFVEYFSSLIIIIDEFIFKQLDLQHKQVGSVITRNGNNNRKIIEEKIEQSTELLLQREEEKTELLSQQNQEIMKLLNDLVFAKNNEVNNIKIKDGSFLCDHLKQALNDHEILFDEETRITLNGEEGHDITGEVIVKYNDFLSNFTNINSLLNYSYYTQKIIELEPISLTLKVGNKILKQYNYINEYNGQVVKFEFHNYGEISILAQHLKNINEKTEFKSILQIHPPELKDFITVNIENEEFESILENICLKIEERNNIGENHVVIIVSNKNQNNCYVYIKFILEIKDGNVIDTTINIEPMKTDSTIYIFKWLSVMKKFKKHETVCARNIDDNSVLFEGVIEFKNNESDIDNDIHFIKNVMFIEKKLDIRFDLPNIIEKDEVNDVITLKSILETGKISVPQIEMKTTFSNIIEDHKFDKNNTYMFHFTSSDKYRLFNREIDLGEQMIILPKVKIKKFDGNELIVESVKKSKNLRIYKNYYGNYEMEEIIKLEKL